MMNKTPTLVASTNDIYSCSIADSYVREKELRGKDVGQEGVEEYLQEVGQEKGRVEEEEVNYFKSAQWTPDGTTLLTSSADNQIRTFVLPPTLLDDPSNPLTITPYTTHSFPTPVNCLTPYPHFSLSDPIPDPSSILWTSPGTHFLTGTDCLISLFDISRNGSGPTTKLPTIPSKRHKMKGGGVGMRGILSALSLQSSTDHNTGTSILAAGTWTRCIGLYDASGLGGTVAIWDISLAADAEAGIGGQGIGEMGWNPIGSTVLHPSGTVVATCSGQRAEPSIKDDTISDDSDEDISDDESASDSNRSQSMVRKAAGRAPDNSLKVWSLT
ncbi:hypothetical protein EYC84_000588 [Monilinia fructicola]|uniref:Uncharacterized protein n=1 Tax=Monilinia fructicola TaxID=38448 RepID=A0A5M9JRK3_MONFR|nr:hypothetical protein EYC84_000588 [Monilinia fructicola]